MCVCKMLYTYIHTHNLFYLSFFSFFTYVFFSFPWQWDLELDNVGLEGRAGFGPLLASGPPMQWGPLVGAA